MCNLAALAERGKTWQKRTSSTFRDYGKRNICCPEMEIRKSGFASTSVYLCAWDLISSWCLALADGFASGNTLSSLCCRNRAEFGVVVWLMVRVIFPVCKDLTASGMFPSFAPCQCNFAESLNRID